ncbi:hypothetical protein [Mycoplasmopsis cynos]
MQGYFSDLAMIQIKMLNESKGICSKNFKSTNR